MFRGKGGKVICHRFLLFTAFNEHKVFIADWYDGFLLSSVGYCTAPTGVLSKKWMNELFIHIWLLGIQMSWTAMSWIVQLGA